MKTEPMEKKKRKKKPELKTEPVRKKKKKNKQPKPTQKKKKKLNDQPRKRNEKKESKGGQKLRLWVPYVCLITILTLSYELWKLKIAKSCFQFP